MKSPESVSGEGVEAILPLPIAPVATDPVGLTDILNFDRNELAQELHDRFKLPPFRANQLVQWLYRRRLTTFEGMSDIARPVREQLTSYYRIYRPERTVVQLSKDGTRKYLFRLSDGKQVETVLIRQPARYTLCVSSQVGCAIGCKFCRTGLMRLTRNLTTAEILGQVLAVQDHIEELRQDANCESIPEFFTNIVFMGMGEPLHNYTNVTRAVRLLNDELGFNFSRRKVTVSTSGLVPAIQKLSEEEVPGSLAVSLNATTNEVRDKLIPINKRWPVETLLQTLREYPIGTRRKVTIEYVMLKDVNDTPEDMVRLPKILHGIPAKVNLIPYNQNAGLGFYAPDKENVARWQEYCLSQGLNATVRWSKGNDISAACGQLATEGRRNTPQGESGAVSASPA